MKKEHILTDLEEKSNIINFDEARKALSFGGKDGEENWLRNLTPGTVFNCRRKNTPKDIIFLDLYCVLDHKAVSSNLMQKIPDGRQVDLWFKTLEFSRLNELVEIIATVEFDRPEAVDKVPTQEEPLITKETTDGNCDRTL